MALLAWMIYRSWEDGQRSIHQTAKISFQKDVVYRIWNSQHGGVFVPVSKHAKPNPYLKDLVKRDINGVNGEQLTLVNPAYMTRQVQELGKTLFSNYEHITSLDPLNKEDNMPDEWEKKSLMLFEKGVKEYSGLWTSNGQEYYRYMAPFKIKETCLKCHEQQSYSVGDIRGGISIAIPMDETRMLFKDAVWRSVFVCLCAWLIGTGMLFLGGNQVRKDIKRRESTEKLINEESEKNTAILSTMPSILVILDAEERITDWNDMATTTFNITRKDALGHRLIDLGLGEDISKIQLRASNSDNTLVFPKVRYECPDGKLGIVHFTASFIRDHQESLLGSVLLGRDILVDMKQQHEDLQTQKMESIGRLSAGIAHEINTPIQYIGDNIRFLQDAFSDIQQLLAKYDILTNNIGDNCEKSTQEMMNAIQESIDDIDLAFILEETAPAFEHALEGIHRVSKIVTAMRSFSYKEQYDEKVATDINQCLKNTVTVARNEYKYVAELVMDLDENLPRVFCVAGAINQVFLNILVNAAHAIEEKIGNHDSGEKGLISISTCVNEDMVTIRFVDTGTGVPDKVINKIFEPFFTTKAIGKGTGQGMSLSHRIIVDEHRGKIEVRNRLEESGAEFLVSLPLKIC